jgi:hypothetical protein
MLYLWLSTVVTHLDEEVLECDRVLAKKLVRILWHECDSKQAAQIVSAGTGGNLKQAVQIVSAGTGGNIKKEKEIAWRQQVPRAHVRSRPPFFSHEKINGRGSSALMTLPCIADKIC